MVKKTSPRRKRRDSAFVVLKVNATLGLSTLANATVLMGSLLDIADDVYLISADLVWSIFDQTPGEGPLNVGIASSNLSVTQVKEAIEASPTSRGDRIALEKSGRPVRQAGIFTGIADSESLNNGNEVRTKLRFRLDQAQTLNTYVFNQSDSSLTTGTKMTVTGKLYARWT